ncbi:hypothetical protein GCM10010954_18020 [Halobacillus andaensis]|uniref:DinB family protein n=1 Tax=Halobacillus andaensis TaxID=1176239 RepID=A0A917B594_HALAA|nr:DinB family protein [Halobacillus andaensis]MBP2004696.1 putative damage-inducible protein DinB [Halobacillus andaensis]GGF19667.1 hypothetical protein GCM10010954_18020 [Halobacillus andaensis]
MSKSARFIDYFLSHREVTKDLVAKIEENQYTFKPTPSSMETEKLVQHILQTTYMFARLAHQQEPDQLIQGDENVSLEKQADLYTEKTLQLISSLSEEDFEKQIDVTRIFGQELTVAELLNVAIDHEIHHKGNLFVYVREMGHTDLPLYVKMN